MRRARDAIAAAGGGRMLFVDGAGSRDDGHFLVGEMTQNGDPTNSGNLCSNLTIERTGAAQIWKDPALPFMFFHNPVGIGTVEEPDVQGPTIRNVRIGAIECMDDVEFLGFSEQEAFFHLNAVADVIFDGTRMIGQRGDAICLNAGDIGGGSQNRFNEGITLRDIFIDGINRNNRNGVSIVSGEKISFEGRCIIKNVTRPGGPGALDLFDINTGVGMPGGVDIEPNAFTADSRTRDITGRIYVINCGGAALGRLMFGQDALPVQHRGIVMEVHAEQCRVGMLSYYGGEDDVTGTDVTLVDSSAVDCDRPFSILRGRGLRMIRPTFYRCPNPAEIGYVDGQSIKDWLMTDAVFDQCGGNGAMLRPLGMDGVEWRNMTVRNCAGGLVQFVGDGTIANFTYDMKIVQDAGAQLSAPTGRFVVNTETGTPDLHVNTIVERSASGYFVPDSAAWQVLGKRSRTVPHTGTWGAGDEVPAVRGLEPGSPRRWLAILPNVLPAKPIFVVDGILPGAAPDPATDSASIVFAKSANMVANGNGRFTAARADQYLYDDNVNNFGVTNGAVGAEMIFAMPYSGTGAIYAGLSKIVQPTTLADLTAGFWFDGEGSALRLIVEGGLYGTEAQALPFAYGGQVRVKCLYEGGAPTATFYRRPGTSGAWTQIDTPVALPTVTVMRLFVLMSYASETLHIVKAGTN
ncbi:MAG: hypothetical protein OSB00_15030 [Sphingomonas bacterium]|nr:hypothetical protein [Sphingomonas bacterium]